MNCREFSINILIEILNKGKYNNISLKNFFIKYPELKSQEKAFITELVNGTIRNLIFIDYIINSFSNTKTEKMKPFILNLLRISVYQIKFMKNVPPSAVCNEAVNLTKKKKFNNLSAFINGVLRNIERNKENINLPDKNNNPIEYLSIVYSTPRWIIELWLYEFGFETVENICKSNLDSPKISICVNTNKIDKEKLKEALQSEKINTESGVLTKNSLYISKTRNIAENKQFKEGFFHIIDESSMLSVEALDLKEGKTLIDVCSAPGGKSFYAAYLMKNKGTILSRDIYKHKIDLIEKGASRLGINIIKTELLDATFENEKSNEKADYLLIDAPCSGLGILRKKPDIKYSKTKEDIQELIKLQRKILHACHKYLKKGGTLVYSTCTLNKEENIENIKWFCKNYDYRLDSLESLFNNKNLEPYDKNTLKQGYIQILPNMYNTDGFFIAKMNRKG